jgi:hypothetical protein
MTDTTLHELSKGFGALLSRSKVRHKCICDTYNYMTDYTSLLISYHNIFVVRIS